LAGSGAYASHTPPAAVSALRHQATVFAAEANASGR
jgi:hypothetical protein